MDGSAISPKELAVFGTPISDTSEYGLDGMDWIGLSMKEIQKEKKKNTYPHFPTMRNETSFPWDDGWHGKEEKTCALEFIIISTLSRALPHPDRGWRWNQRTTKNHQHVNPKRRRTPACRDLGKYAYTTLGYPSKN